MMLRPSMYQIISKNESYYSLVIGVAKRAKMNGDQKIRLDDKTMRMVVLEENPVKTAVDEFAAGKYKLVEPVEDNDR